MNHFEMAQALREKTGVTYEEARQALEAANWDLLEAIVTLERNGKLKAQDARPEAGGSARARQAAKAAEGGFHTFINWVKNLVDKGNRSQFVITKEGRQALRVPVTVAVLLLLFLHGAFLLALLVGLMAGYRFTFEGEKEAAAYAKDVEEARAAAEQINHHHTVNSFGEGI